MEAIQEQAANLMHISNFFVSEPQMQLAEKLSELSGLKYVFFSNSGAESNEGAIKIARKYARKNGRGGVVVSMKGCFHGRTLATIATGNRPSQIDFSPLPNGFTQVELNNFDCLKTIISNHTAAIIVEPVQGEGGIHEAKPEYLRKLRALCDEKNIVLIYDEIQCGMGRIGQPFGWQHSGVQPDIITLAKGLGGGFPIGAIVTNEKVGNAMDFGDHGTTFGGNPLGCAAANAYLKVMEEEKLPQKALETGNWLMEKLNQLKSDYNFIKDVRGVGLMIGVEFDFETKPLFRKLLDKGVIANATAGNVLRLVPPLNIKQEQLSYFLEILKTELDNV